jgi:hypothetical protein
MNPVEMNLNGLVLLEPLTSLTDITTGLVGLYFGYRLTKSTAKSESQRLFTLYFLFMGIATFCGGVFGHALLHYISWDWKVLGWIFGAFGLFCLENASLSYFKSYLNRKVFVAIRYVTVAQLLIYIGSTLFRQTRVFEAVSLNATFGYVVVIIPIYLFSIVRLKKRESWFILFSIGLAAITGSIYTNEITYNDWFNHHVLTHLAMSVFIFVMYYAVKNLINSAVLTVKS